MIGKLIRILKHPRVIRDALTNAAWMVDGDIAEKAICGLTEEETAALVRWLPDEGTFVEFGTLFGLTAKTVAAAKPKLKVIAVDNFSWNPFGMPAELHEKFTRLILENELKSGRVELVKTDAQEFLKTMKDVDVVFLDGDHRYEAVKAEIELVKNAGVKMIAGHD